MKKTFKIMVSLILSMLMISSLALVAFAGNYDSTNDQGKDHRYIATVAKASKAIVLDGVIDDVWAEATETYTIFNNGMTDGPSAKLRFLWDTGALYVLVEIGG